MAHEAPPDSQDTPIEDSNEQRAAHCHRKYLRGWYSYAFASEAFVIVSLTLFLPICLEQFARDNGVLLPDKTQPCSSIQISETGHADTASADDKTQCVVKIGWLWVSSASFSLYVYSTSVALQALTVISMGGIANHPPHRKLLLLLFAFIGSLSTILILPLSSTSSLWPLIAPLSVLANVGFGASIVAMNAYLPMLAKGDADVRKLAREVGEIRSESDGDDASPLLSQDSPSTSPNTPYTTLLSRTTARISGTGIALGYTAGILLLLLALLPVSLMHGSTFALRLAIGMSGVWWALGSIPAWIWLPDGEDAEAVKSDRTFSLKKEVWNAWKTLGRMLRWREIKRLTNTFLYLAAWFLLSDGFTTITSTAILFGKTTLHMSASSLILIGILTPTSGILGSLLWPRIQRSLQLHTRTVLVTLVLLASLVPAYGCLGFLPIFKDIGVDVSVSDANDGQTSTYRLRFGGLTSQEEMFALAVYFGTVYGAFQGYARAFYAELIPPGDEARWFGLFSITDKSSSFLGPLLVGLIADLTGNIRYAFFFLVVMVWAAVPLLLSVNLEKGREDARRYAVERRAET